MKKNTLYQDIYEKLKSQIINGDYPIQTTLPDSKKLMAEYNVSSITVNRALNELKKSGLIARQPHVGSTVISDKEKVFLPEKEQILVGVILTCLDDILGISILEGIVRNAPKNIHLIIKESDGSTQKEDAYITELIEFGVKGLILLPASSEYLGPKLLKLIASDFPTVVIDRVIEGLPVSSVTIDNEGSAETLTNYLFSNGHTKIGFISSTVKVSTISERRKGFIRAHAMSGLSLNPDYIKHLVSFDPNDNITHKKNDIKNIKNFLSNHSELTAVLATEYKTALLVGQACRELSISIPKDLSLVCYDHPKTDFLISPFIITHIEQDLLQLGSKSIGVLCRKMNGETQIEKLIVQSYLVAGSSVGIITEKEHQSHL